MILNRASDGLLSVLIVLQRALASYGPMRRDRLVALVAPATAVKDDSKVKQTLNRWTQLGVFVESASRIQLSPTFASIAVDDIEGLRTALFELTLRPENNPPEGKADDGSPEAPGATDFTSAAAWALQQDPYALVNIDNPVEHERSQEVSPDVFKNETRWDGFRDWAPFFGIAVAFKRGRQTRLLLNPARAIRAVLPEVIPAGERNGIDSVLQLIGERLPILDGGQYWQSLAERTKHPWRRFGASELSPSLSLALRQLRHEGLIRLEDLSDAPKRYALLGRAGRVLESATHVTRVDA